jgi:PilZ domain
VVTDRSTFDRRKYPRVRTESLVSIARVDTRESLAHALDVSIGGIRFQCVGLEVDLGETLRVQLTIGDRTIQVVGKLVRVTDLDGFTQEVALSFTEVDDDTLRFLTASLPEGYELEPNEK